MIIVDENSEHYRRVTLTKWKETLPAITEEAALYCERQLIDMANKKLTEEVALKNINEYLTKLKLIKSNE